MSDYMTPERVAEARGAGYILQRLCHELAVDCGWYSDPVTGERKERNTAELIALCHSELSEALEGLRKDLDDTHLPHRKNAEVELGDCVIRICDMAGYLGYDIGGAIAEKLVYNSKRADHKPENRAKAGGKKF